MNIEELRAKRAEAWKKANEFRQANKRGEKVDIDTWEAALDEVESIDRDIRTELGNTIDAPTTVIGGGARFDGPARFGRPLGANRFTDLPGGHGDATEVAEVLDPLFRAVALRQQQGPNYERAIEIAQRAGMIEGTGTLGGYGVPDIVARSIWDKARANMVTAEAGLTVVPFEDGPGGTFTIPVANEDITFEWLGEGETSSEQAPTITARVLSPFTARAIVTASRELVQDAAFDVGGFVVDGASKALAQTVDARVLTGPASGGPQGLLNNPAITSSSTHHAVDLHYDFVAEAVANRRAVNEYPTAAIMSPRSYKQLTLAKEATTNAYLAPPKYLDGVKFLETSAVPTNITVSSSSDASPVFVADFSQAVLGVRLGLQVLPLEERYAEQNKVGWLFVARFDTAVPRPAAFETIYAGTT